MNCPRDIILYLCIVCVVSASILRHVYLRNGIGVGHLTRVYGGMEYSTDSNVCIEVIRRLCSTEEIGGGGISVMLSCQLCQALDEVFYHYYS